MTPPELLVSATVEPMWSSVKYCRIAETPSFPGYSRRRHIAVRHHRHAVGQIAELQLRQMQAFF
jgi:hypothetical protein